MDAQQRKKNLQTFIADKGFIIGPEPEIYQGVAGFYTYGPLGKSLKNKIEKAIKQVFMQYDFWEVECPTILPNCVWEASGHLGNFTDPMIYDTKKNRYRVDKLIEEWCAKHNINPDTLQLASCTHQDFLDLIAKHTITAPDGTALVPNITDHNLMLQTTIGFDTPAANRPETATTTYLPFLRYNQFFRQKYPFGVFQIGKAYRNEVSPRQSVLRGREFTQAEGQLFILEEQKKTFDRFVSVQDKVLPFWSTSMQSQDKPVQDMTLQQAVESGLLGSQAYAWTIALAYDLFISMGIDKKHIRLRQHHDDEKAFYAADAWDIELHFSSFGWVEVCGVHDRTQYDLQTHSKHSQTELSVTLEDGTKQTPHIIEIAFGVDRPLYALLDMAYSGDEQKPVLQLPYQMAPIDVAVFPLVNKPEVLQKAYEVYALLQPHFITWFDKSGSIGKRYVRQDEIGTPYAVTIDFDTLQDNTVTLRDRDTKQQERISIAQLRDRLHTK
ncbi:MAG: glycine--tRNA ligase [Candidatus Woesearchaeota archaeon]